MIKKLLLFLTLFQLNFLNAQINGIVKNQNQQVLQNVSVIIKSKNIGSNTNEKGFYNINTTIPGSYTLIFKSIGFKTLIKNIEINKFPYEVSVILDEEIEELTEMVIMSKKEDPAYDIIRNTIAAKKTNDAKIQKLSANIYSKHSTYLDTIPDKILMFDIKKEKQKINYDKSKYAELAELHSNLKFKHPNLFYEVITAANLSGKNNGIPNSGYKDIEVNFYNNNIVNIEDAISPLSNLAFKYYKFKLVNTFIDENNQMINKIEVINKSDVEATFSGHIYIVENTWDIYAVDLKIIGKSLKAPNLNYLIIKQQYNYNTDLKIWYKISQNVTYKMEILSAKIIKNYNTIFSNVFINEQTNHLDFSFTKNTTLIDPKSKTKSATYWENRRPIPLEKLEQKDFKVKDSLHKVIIPKKDSIIKYNHTKFSFSNVFEGYNNYFKTSKINLKYSGIIDNVRYNTVQGFNTKLNLETSIYGIVKNGITLGTNVSYGVSENKFRINGYIQKKINRHLDQSIKISGGSDILQYNTQAPINEIINSVASLAFRENFAKYYQTQFINVAFQTNLTDYLKGFIQLNHTYRSALQNKSNNNIFNWDKEFTSNNPLNPLNDDLAFKNNSTSKLKMSGILNFNRNQKGETKFPVLKLDYEHVFQSDIQNYAFQKIETNVNYNVKLNQFGSFSSNLNLSSIFNKSQDLLFIDYKHFNGNQTHIFDPTQNNTQFNLLPYYKYSTQNSAITLNVAYNDKGFIINKIPLLKHTQFNFIGNLNLLSTSNNKPYIEYATGFDNIGFGPYRIFKAQYTFTNQNTHGFIFGINTTIF